MSSWDTEQARELFQILPFYNTFIKNLTLKNYQT